MALQLLIQAMRRRLVTGQASHKKRTYHMEGQTHAMIHLHAPTHSRTQVCANLPIALPNCWQ
jgi:hypothetical protein